MNDTGFHVFGSSSCNRTAPRPYDDASAAIFDALLGSYNVSTGAEVNAILTLLKASCCGGSQVQVLVLTRSFRMGCVKSARLLVNLLNW